MTGRTIVRGRWVIPGAAASDKIVGDGAVVVEGDRVVETGDRATLAAKYPDADVVGSDDVAVMPGLVNAHHHSWAATSIQHARPDRQLEPWILSGKRNRKSDDYLDTLLAAARQMAGGVTSVVDAYFGGGTADEYSAAVGKGIRAYEEAGMRVAFSTGVDTQSFIVWGKGEDQRFIDSLPSELRAGAAEFLPRPGDITGDEYLAIIEDYKRRYESHPRIDVWFGPGGPHWMPDDLLAKVAERAAAIDTRIQTHCVETIYEKMHGFRFYGKPTMLHLRDLGFLSPRLSVAHGIWMTEEEIEAVAAARVSVSHNPSSNLRLRAGIAPVLRFREAGINVGIGMDGFAINDDEDMFSELRLAWRLNGTPPLDGPGLTPTDALAMATTGGAALMGKDKVLGRLAPGYLADLILVDLKRITTPWVAPEADLRDLIVYRARLGDVRTVMVGGEVVFRDGKPTRFDVDAVVAEVSALLSSQPFRAERSELVMKLLPILHAWYRGWEPPEADPYYRYNSRR
jgi:cytosine/adenosine deaminase-related metal-dependent hydrolase